MLSMSYSTLSSTHTHTHTLANRVIRSPRYIIYTIHSVGFCLHNDPQYNTNFDRITSYVRYYKPTRGQLKLLPFTLPNSGYCYSTDGAAIVYTTTTTSSPFLSSISYLYTTCILLIDVYYSDLPVAINGTLITTTFLLCSVEL